MIQLIVMPFDSMTLITFLSQVTAILIETINSLPVEELAENRNNLSEHLPWLVALVIGLLTVIANYIISYQNRIGNREAIDQQIQTALETTKMQIDASLKMAQIEFNKTVLSGNRQDWINRLRNLISDYLSVTKIYNFVQKAQEGNSVEEKLKTDEKYINQILKLESEIVLMLNTDEPESANLKKLLSQYSESLFQTDVLTQSPEFFSSEIIKSVKTILKSEWIRVKRGE